jgi:hypothetical protein
MRADPSAWTGHERTVEQECHDQMKRHEAEKAQEAENHTPEDATEG